MDAKTIIVAWVEEGVVGLGPDLGVDLGRMRKVKYGSIAHAVCWANHGDATDLAKAKAWMQREVGSRGRVYQYDPSEKRPLEKAREAILREAQSGVVQA